MARIEISDLQINEELTAESGAGIVGGFGRNNQVLQSSPGIPFLGLGSGIGFGGNTLFPGFSPAQSSLPGTISFASASAFSDRRLKRNITQIGKTSRGQDVYSYEYVWGGGKTVGVMADEVPTGAAHQTRGGFAMVDYAQV